MATFTFEPMTLNLKMSVCFFAVLLLFVTACQKADNNFNARISFLNGSVGAGSFTIKFNEDILIAAIPFDSLKKHSVVPSGTFKIGFYRGTNPAADFSFTTNIESGNDYTCFTFDSVDRYKVFFQKDILPGKVTDGKCAVRFFSLIPNSENLSLQNDTGRVFLSGKSFASFANTFEETDTTSRQIKIKTTGATAALDSLFKPLVAGKIYTLFLTGSINGTGVQKPKMIFLEHN